MTTNTPARLAAIRERLVNEYTLGRHDRIVAETDCEYQWCGETALANSVYCFGHAFDVHTAKSDIAFLLDALTAAARDGDVVSAARQMMRMIDGSHMTGGGLVLHEKDGFTMVEMQDALNALYLADHARHAPAREGTHDANPTPNTTP